MRRGERTVALSSREWDLLVYLARRRGQVVSRRELLREVWGLSSDSNVLTVYVSYLREKLEEGGASRLLHTVPHHGYMLDA